MPAKPLRLPKGVLGIGRPSTAAWLKGRKIARIRQLYQVDPAKAVREFHGKGLGV